MSSLILNATGNQIVMVIRCRVCGTEKVLHLDKKKFSDWRNGELIQNCFPELSAGDRELLISGTCDECFHKMFGIEEED